MKINDKQAAELSKSLADLQTDDIVAAVELKQESHSNRPSSIFVEHLNRSGKIVKVEKILPDGSRWEKSR